MWFPFLPIILFSGESCVVNKYKGNLRIAFMYQNIWLIWIYQCLLKNQDPCRKGVWQNISFEKVLFGYNFHDFCNKTFVNSRKTHN